MLNLLFIPAWGFYGAAFATTLSQITFFALVYYFAQRHYKIPYEVKKIVLMIFTGILIYAAGLMTDPWSLFLRLPAKALLIGTFPFIISWFGFYEPIELERMGQFWQKWRNPLYWGKNLRKIKLN